MRAREMRPATAGMIVAVVALVVAVIGWMMINRQHGGAVGSPPTGVPGAPAPGAMGR